MTREQGTEHGWKLTSTTVLVQTMESAGYIYNTEIFDNKLEHPVICTVTVVQTKFWQKIYKKVNLCGKCQNTGNEKLYCINFLAESIDELHALCNNVAIIENCSLKRLNKKLFSWCGRFSALHTFCITRMHTLQR